MPREVLSAGPEWLVVLLAVLIGLKFAAQLISEASETGARLLGPLGRRWRERGLRRQEDRAKERTARMADLEDAERQRDSLAASLERSRREQETQAGYIEYDSMWHRDIRLQAIDSGCDKLLEHKSFLQWREAQS